jgi:hypothetical protein
VGLPSGGHPLPGNHAMSFALLRHTPHGWTDIHGDSPAEFPTRDDAWDAAIELDDSWATASTWRIVPTTELATFALVAGNS